MDSHRVPSCDVIDPGGRRVTVHPHLPSDRVADLASALAADPHAHLRVDGRRVRPHETLVEAGIRWGSTLSIVEESDTDGVAEDAHGGAPLDYAVITGPSCDRWRPLASGGHVVGRADRAAVQLDDPTVEMHHGRLEVESDATVTFVQLTGRTPVEVGDGEVGDGADSDDPASAGERRYTIGSSVIALRAVPSPGDADVSSPSGSVVACEGDPWREVVRRGPTRPSSHPPDELTVPDRPSANRSPPAVGLIGAAVAAAGAGIMAVVLRQPLFAVFALIGAVGSFATWMAGAVSTRRERRRVDARYAASVDEFTAAIVAHRADGVRRHLEDHPSVIDALHAVHDDRGRVWCRRVAAEGLRVTIGRGDVVRAAPISAAGREALRPDLMAAVAAAEKLHDVPAPFLLRPGTTTALHGDMELGVSLARSIIVQLAAFYGPADLRIAVVTSHPQDWEWTDWLPHGCRPIDARSPAHVEDIRALTDDRDGSVATVVVTDASELLTERTGVTRRMLTATRATCVVITSGQQTVPAVCDTVVEVGASGHLRWRSARDGAPETGCVSDTARLAGLTVQAATDAARRLAPLIDPETEERTSGLPHSVGFGVVDPVATGAVPILRRWRASGADPALAATLGVTGDGTVGVDLVRDGPHALIAGTTGAGKSELLRTLIVGLAAGVSPDHLAFVLVDFKGGSAFDACSRLPHVVGMVTDLDHGLAERALLSLDAEIARRERLLRGVGADDLAGYRRATAVPLPRLVVVIDEFASLAKELPDFLTSLVGVAQRGRSLGIHLILATQRPAGVVNDDIRANTNLRLALRVQDPGDATDVVGDATPAAFPRSTPGHAALRLGADELIVFQAASCTGPPQRSVDRLRIEPSRSRAAIDGALTAGSDERTELSDLVDAIVEAARMGDVAAPHRPWLEPLPTVLRESTDEAVGVADDPARQRRVPLRWDGRSGNLLLVGSLGSGTTTAAVALAAATLRRPDPGHLYVVDGRGDRRWDDVATFDRCGALIQANETERLTRLLHRLTDDISTRAVGRTSAPRITLFIDGLGPVRAALAAINAGETSSLLDRVLTDGPAVGIASCVTTDGSSTVSLAAPAAHRWVFRLDDPTVARAVGANGRVPALDVPGRLRVVESGLEAQVACDPRLPRLPCRTSPDAPPVRAPSVDLLPSHVDPTRLDEPDAVEAHDSPDSSLVVGLGAHDLAPARLRVPDGDHIFVGGAAGTGKSTAIRQLTSAWRARRPDGIVEVLGVGEDPHRVARTWAERGARPLLVVVDDADRVDDVGGVLLGFATRREVGTTLIVAARLEAVRAAYGHWVREVARRRCGLIMTSPGELDGDLLGAMLPRRTMIPPRPGLAWLVDGSGHQLVQVAARLEA